MHLPSRKSCSADRFNMIRAAIPEVSIRYPSPERNHLSSPHLWAGELVLGWSWAVEVDEDTGILGAVGSWERSRSRWGAAATAGDVDVATGKVELGTTDVASVVDGNVLNTEDILAISEGGWEGDLNLGLACIRSTVNM